MSCSFFPFNGRLRLESTQLRLQIGIGGRRKHQVVMKRDNICAYRSLKSSPYEFISTPAIYSNYVGTEVEFNGVKHLLLKEDDIVVRITETDDIVEKTDGTTYNEDSEHHVTTTERSDVLPLLANKANDTTKKSNVDDLAKISLMVYVSNFLSHLTVHELWNICGKVGTVTDVYIANRKNKLGQMFVFCRYIKVVNYDNLIHSLSNIWIGKLRLHANVARFGRKVDIKPSYAGVKVNTPVINRDRYHPASNNSASYVNVANASTVDGMQGSKSVNDDCGDHISVVELKQHTPNDFPLAVLGRLWLLFEFKSLEARNEFLKHDGIFSWFSSLKPWHDDFIVEERLIWLEIEGVPIRTWEDETFKSICNKWGEVIFSDDIDPCNRLSKHPCIKSNHNQLIFATSFVSLMKVTYAIRVRELYSWTPTYVGVDSDRDDEGSMGSHDQEENVELVGGIFVEDNGDAHTKDDYVHDSYQDEEANVVGSNQQHSHQDALDSDPFGLEPLINKKFGKEDAPQNSVTPEFPPGFSPSPITDKFVNQPEVQNFVQPPVSESSHSSLGDTHKPIGFSMVERLEETIKIGTTLGLNMKGCENTLAALIANNGEETNMVHVDMWMLRQVWGNIHFHFVFMSSRGIWIPNDVRIMWIAVYAPQSLHDKIALWSSLTNLINNWDGILIALGDFNMVREAGERFGSNFNERHAEIFNAFISNSFLIDVPLDQGTVNDLDFLNRRDSTRILGDIDRLEASDLAQKARIKWAMEGDENTSFFHAMLKKNRRQLAIKGILNNGEWLEEPDSVKAIFMEHFRNRSFPKGCNSSFIALIPKVSNATLVTDFRPISLIGCQYKIIGKILANRLGLVIGSCISPEQSAFIKGRNILDGPLILNEVMNWYRKRKEKLMIFKVDFEKAFVGI
ncbi:RNA-directed DNA polymerase, eukaryota [Tanacetum coccineum]